VKPDRYADDEEGLVWAPIFPARVLHFPIRSFEQYKRRVETTIFHGGFEDQAHDELRERYEAGELPELYTELAVDDDALEAGIAAGRLVRDPTVVDVLARAPDPVAAGAVAAASEDAGRAPAGRTASAADGEDEGHELREIEHDAMATLARTQRSLIRQLDAHRTRAERQRRKLKRMRRQQGGALRRLSARVRRESSR
jgi:hypothetical protein